MYQIRYLAAPNELTVSQANLLNPLLEAFRGVWNNDHKIIDIANAHWWLAWKDGEPVAFAGMTEYQPTQSCVLYLSGVLPEHRGNGLQRRLIRAREAKAKRLGYQRIVTYTWVANLPSQRNLEACGYEVYRPDREWGAVGSVYYEKRLG